MLTQRNSLLKQLRDQGADSRAPAVEAQLAFWDERLAQDGAVVMARRQDFLIELEGLARARHEELSGGRELLRLYYLPSFNTGLVPDADFEHYQGGLLDEVSRAPADVDQIRARFRQKLGSRRSRELAAGVTLYGPHRDDLRFVANGRDLRTYGSRGQQRSAALAVKLAEVRAMTVATGSAPLLLLDDVMSELDAQRRSTLLAVLHDVPQAIVTTTDWDDFTPRIPPPGPTPDRECRRRHACHQLKPGPRNQIYPMVNTVGKFGAGRAVAAGDKKPGRILLLPGLVRRRLPLLQGRLQIGPAYHALFHLSRAHSQLTID